MTVRNMTVVNAGRPYQVDGSGRAGAFGSQRHQGAPDADRQQGGKGDRIDRNRGRPDEEPGDEERGYP